MAKHVNLARMIVVGGGTGPLTLTTASPASLTFTDAGVVNGDVVSYGLRTDTDSEVGYGTYNAGVLTRTSVVSSTNGGAPIDVTGTGEVFITLLAGDLATGTYNGLMAAADKAKLDGIAAGATANATDAQLRDRSTHTGTQAISTVSGLQTALDGKLAATKAAVSAVIGGNAVTSGALDTVIGWDGGATKATFAMGATDYGVTWPIDITGQSAHSYSSTYAYSSARFNEELPSYYTDIPARLGYTPARTDPVTTSANGLMIAADKVKLNGIAAGATANATDAQLRDRATHTGTQAISTVAGLQSALDAKAGLSTATTAANGLMAAADKAKLDGIAAGATANATDAQLRDRSTHTGTQAISTVAGLQAALDAKAALTQVVRFDTTQSLTPAQQGVARANIDAGLLAGFRNKIINGNFDVWQRGLSQDAVAQGYGSDDRWRNDSGVATKVTSRQAFPIGQTGVPGNPAMFSRTVVTPSTNANALVMKSQRLEGATSLASQRVTLTFYAKASASRTIAVEFVQSFGTGGSADVLGIEPKKFNLTTAWQKFSHTFVMPSVAGKIIGSTGNDYVSVNFWFLAGSSYNARTDTLNNGGSTQFTIDLARVSLVEGDATAESDPFSPRHMQQEYALCQRYFQISTILPGAYYNTTTATAAAILPVQMRGTPTVALTPTAKLLEPGIANRDILTVTGALTSGIGGQVDMTTAAIANPKPACFVVAGSLSFDAEL